MIDKKHKLILVHLPKTGGTSAARALGSNIDEGFGTKHWTLKRYRQMVSDFSDYHTFGFVRNPWARMASWYRFKMKRGYTFGLDFNQWVKHPTVRGLPRRKEEFFFLDGQFALDSVGRFEDLERDFKRIVFPFMGDIDLPHRFNLGPNKNYADYYDQELIDIVTERHKWVIEEFGYSFEQLSATEDS